MTEEQQPMRDGLQQKRMSRIIALAAAIESFELKRGHKTEADIEEENKAIEEQEMHENIAGAALDDMGHSTGEPAYLPNRKQRRRMAKNARKNK